MIPKTQKSCIRCKSSKPLAEYYKHMQMADKHLNKCKDCCRSDANAHRAKNLTVCQEYDRMRARLPHRKKKLVDYSNSDRRKNAKVANCAVNNAIRDGRLMKQPCEKCGNEKAQAHHDDYLDKLNVRWLCQIHHTEWHKSNRALNPC